jgi:hypothetical protein
MMRHCEDDDALGLHAVEERETKPLDDDTARIPARRRPGVWKGKGTGGGFLDGRREALAQAGLRFIVVDDLG